MTRFEKHFTVEEARSELPEVRQLLSRVQELLEVVKQGQLELRRFMELVRSNGHGSGHPEVGMQVAEIQAIVRDITGRGIEIKDLERGLIDFPHLRDGEEVYLCWLYGEEDIRYWHTVEGGFAGRTEL